MLHFKFHCFKYQSYNVSVFIYLTALKSFRDYANKILRVVCEVYFSLISSYLQFDLLKFWHALSTVFSKLLPNCLQSRRETVWTDSRPLTLTPRGRHLRGWGRETADCWPVVTSLESGVEYYYL